MSETPTADAEPTPEGAVEVPPASDPTPAPEPTPVTVAAPAAPAAPTAKKSVQVPVWLLVVLAAGVLVVGAFFVGRETAPDGGASGPTTLAEAVEQTASGDMEVGDFDVRALLRAIGENRNLDLGTLGEIILGGGRS